MKEKTYWMASPKLLIAISLLALFLISLIYAKAYLDYESNTIKWFVNLDSNEKTSPSESLGATGDYIGGILNPILSFFSFLALLLTIRIQLKELINSREELKRSADAQKESADSLRIQNSTSELSKFENTFFNLINLHNDILRDISSETIRHSSSGAVTKLSIIKRTLSAVRRCQDLDAARRYLIRGQDDIDHYFRIVYQILKLIDKSEIIDNTSSQNKRFYSGVLRSIIDQDALELIAVNAAEKNMSSSFYKYKILIEKYSFLEHLKKDPLSLKILTDIPKIYSTEAFGKSIHFK